jgi:two-component sensor histidine kinase
MDSVGIVAGVRARPVLRVGTMFSIEGKMYAGVVEQALFPHSLPLLAAIAFGLVVLVFVLLGVNRTRSRFEETIAVALEEMAKNASKMSAGDFDLRTPASEVSEIDRLSQSLNAMAEQTGGHIEELERRLAEREELLREVNHRVKNNLQLISSMLSLQAGRSADRHEIDFLETARNRVRAMSLVHEQLYDPEQLAEIRFDDYLRRLSREARSRWSTLTPAPEIEVRGGEVHLNLQNAIPSGLLVSELLDNSLRHAFGPERDGRIVVSAESASEATITLRVADNGRGGVPEEAENYGVGLRLVKALAQQLRGALEIQSGPGGTEVSVQFPSSPGPTRTGV